MDRKIADIREELEWELLDIATTPEPTHMYMIPGEFKTYLCKENLANGG
jgi:hypothetical protein